MNTKELGVLGEKIALNYLKEKGYKILDKNYAPRFISGPLRGEIDIVAKKDDIVSFIEVKTLTQNCGGQNCGGPTSAISPEEKVDYLKQKKIMKMAESWLMENKIPLESPWQIDVIAIKIDLNNRKAKIRHFKNAVF